MTHVVRGRVLLLCAALAVPQPAPAQEARAEALSQAAGEPPPGSPLDVPFVSQTPALCGGAAVAMVLRYWGERGVFADEFAPLVVPSREGIRTRDLALAVERRGWRAAPFAGTSGLVRGHLARGWPVIALIEDRPERYHYVVIVGWDDDGRVRLHDPARGPLRVLDETRFDRAWQASGRWAMLVLPAPDTARPANGSVAAVDTVRGACAAALEPAAAYARGGDTAAAERALDAAAAHCPDGVLLIERAALRFRAGRYVEAAALSSRALALQPDDVYGWDLLGSSRYLSDDVNGALAAWNRIGRPRNDLTRITGLRQTRFAVIERSIGIAPAERVTPEALGRAARRVAALPTVTHARVDYLPVRGGDVEVRAAIVERPVLPLGAADAVAHAVRAAAAQSIELIVSGPAGAGEQWRASWGWRSGRRDAGITLIAPGAFDLPFVWQLGMTDRLRTFVAGGPAIRERTQSASLELSDWASAALHYAARVSLAERNDTTSIGMGVDIELRTIGDHAAVRIAADGWLPAGGGPPFSRIRLRAHAATGVHAAWEVRARAGADVASATGPRSHWAGAGAEQDADALLRGHSLLERSGAVHSDFLAPRLLHGGIELVRWLDIGPLRIGAAAFIDAALRAGAVITQTSPAVQRGALDTGVGLRARMPGMTGMLRIDAARGVNERTSALSIGWNLNE